MTGKVSFSAILLVPLTLLFATAACSKDPEVVKREYVRSGDAYVAKKQYKEAAIEYRNAVQQDAKFGEARAKLADAYLEAGDVENAVRENIRAADGLPNDVSAQVKSGEVL